MSYPTGNVLRVARSLYASAPDHTPATGNPADGTYCLVTAVSEAASQAQLTGEAEAWDCDIPLGVIRKEIKAQYDKYAGVVAFNATHTTYEVLAVFDGAIRRAA